MSGRIEGFRDQMVRAGEIRMHAVVGGKGPPLVLLHGFPQTWWEWHKVMPQLAETHTVVAVDLRGAGHSDCPQGGYDKATMAADVDAVMQASRVQPVVATVVCASRKCSSNASAGVLQPRVLRGLVLRASATASRASVL